MVFSDMNYIDLILFAIIGLCVYQGWRKGFISSLFELIIWVGSFIAALFLSGYLARLFHLIFDVTDLWIRPLSFILTLIISSRIIAVLGEKLIGKVDPETHDHPVNKIAGFLPGILTGLIYAALLSLLLLTYPLGAASKEAEESPVARALTRSPAWLDEQLSTIFTGFGSSIGNSVTIHPKANEIVNLPFKTTNIKVRKDLELRMLDLVNEERRKEGLNLLTFDEELAVVARKHSADMFKRGYFSHFTPEGKNPFDRIRREKISFRIAGENLALAQSLELAHDGLMKSPTHKANILHKSFGRLGVGIQDGGKYGIIVTQNFRN